MSRPWQTRYRAEDAHTPSAYSGSMTQHNGLFSHQHRAKATGAAVGGGEHHHYSTVSVCCTSAGWHWPKYKEQCLFCGWSQCVWLVVWFTAAVTLSFLQSSWEPLLLSLWRRPTRQKKRLCKLCFLHITCMVTARRMLSVLGRSPFIHFPYTSPPPPLAPSSSLCLPLSTWLANEPDKLVLAWNNWGVGRGGVERLVRTKDPASQTGMSREAECVSSLGPC